MNKISNISLTYLLFVFFSRMSSEGVFGFGFADNQLIVMVLKQKCQNLKEGSPSEDRIKKKIEKEVSPLSVKVKWFSEIPFVLYTETGDRLISKSKLDHYKEKGGGFGAVGVFGHTENKDLVFTTAGHVVEEEEKAYVRDYETKVSKHLPKDLVPESSASASNPAILAYKQRSISKQSMDSVSSTDGSSLTEDFIQIGTCVANIGKGLENDADFAIVQILKEETNKVNANIFKTKLTSTPRTISLYKKPDSLFGEIVHKVGPDTRLTDGIVVCDPFHFTGDDLKKKRRYILVESKDSTKPFAKPGDSGSAVYRLSFEDEQSNAEIISTLLMGPTEDQRIEQCFVTHRMDEALQELDEMKHIRVDINQKL